MPSKSKEAHLFKVGDRAIVRDVPLSKVVDSGIVVEVKPMVVIFESTLSTEGRPRRFGYKRKGTRWVERKKDHFELEPPR